MLCPAQILGYLYAIRLARRGASCGVRWLAAAVCRSGLPGRAPRIRHIRDRSILPTVLLYLGIRIEGEAILEEKEGD